MKKINEMPRKNFVLALLAFCIAAAAAFVEVNPAKADESAPPEASMKAEVLPKGVAHLKFKAGLLEIKAEGAELAEVLKAISKEIGVEIDNPDEINGIVTLEVKGSWLQDGLTKILEAGKVNGYAFNFNDSKEPRLAKITILRSGKDDGKSVSIAQKPANYPAPGLKRRWTDEEAKAYFQTKYGEWLDGDVADDIPDYVGHPFRQAGGALPAWIKIENLEDALRLAEAFIADNPEAFQLGESELRPRFKFWTGDFSKIEFEQFYKGIPVEYGYVAFTFGAKGRAIDIFNNIGKAFELSTEPKITAEEAVEIAEKDIKRLREQGIKRDESQISGENLTKPRHIIRRSLAGLPVLMWEFDLDDRHYIIDANTAEFTSDYKITTVRTKTR